MKFNKEKILGFMKDKAYRPLSIKELMRRLGIPREERTGFKKSIKDMVVSGTLIRIRGGRYGPPSKMNLVTGELHCHPNGFGFVAPDNGEDDIFINPRNMKGAMHRDRVVARVERFKGDRKREGRIIRILERGQKRIVGRFERGRGFAVVAPSDERILQDIIIPPRNTRSAEDGHIVEVEITRWPAEHLAPSGRVIGILGNYDDPDVEIEVIVKKYGLPHRFPADVTAEAEEIPQMVLKREIKDRTDLRERKMVTIDGETAKDFDDAVSIEKTRGGYRLWVSIADVSHYVRENSMLDLEAFKRGTSIYFPDRCIPMLPEPLSNGICSLNPGVDRLAFTVEIDFDGNGVPLKSRFYESVINSKERLTYTTVKALLLNEDKKLRERFSNILEDLSIMNELCLKLKARRDEAGSIDFDLPEPQIIIDIEGKIEDIVRSERNIAHQIIEEFMLSVNRVVATHMATVPFLYRVHNEPDNESIQGFMEFAHNFGYSLKKKKDTSHLFQEILKKADGRPEERLINHVLLRSMKQARYSEENTGHFGLAFDNYTHFTSPIRRYPDLVVHRLLKRMAKGRYTTREKKRWEALLPDIANQNSKRERIAMEAEREIVDLKKVQFMKDKVGELYPGFISGVTSFGLFVELTEYFVEGLVHISGLMDDYYTFIEKEHSLVGEHTKKRYSIGDNVQVQIEGVDLGKRQITMRLIEDMD
ncbi:MAG: ribonuclease R, partial [Thermodesulfobacteriota bacterium]